MVPRQLMIVNSPNPAPPADATPSPVAATAADGGGGTNSTHCIDCGVIPTNQVC